METEVAKCSVDKKYFEIEKKEINLDNDRLLEHIICQDVMNFVMHVDSLSVNVLPANNKYIVHIYVNSLATLNNYAKMEQDYIDEYSENLMRKAELAKKEHMVEKKFFDEVVLRCSRIENRSVNLELKLQHQKESFMNNRPFNNQHAPEIQEFFHINEWQAKLDAKDVSIAKLKKQIENLKGKNVLEKDVQPNNPNVIALIMFKLDLEPLAPREVLVYVKDTCLCLTKASEKLVAVTLINRTKRVSSSEASGSKPRSNTKKDRISQTSNSNKKKNKVEDHPRIAKSSLNNKNSVIEPVCNANVEHTT
ncbi:hypothetical protein Tco_1474089 [Tanacetum coccineum]